MNNINPKIKKVLLDHNINSEVGTLVLLSIYHKLDLPSAIEECFKPVISKINVLKIVDIDYDENKLVWNIPLYEQTEESVSTQWEWVLTEYRPLFKNVNKTRGGTPSSCLKKMKAFFANHPEVRKDDVIAATKQYIASLSSPDYLQSADYFIIKGRGTETTSRLEQFLELVKETSSIDKTKDMM